jgi:hypothetical protein
VTFHKDNLQWENGAGRISTAHKKALSLYEKIFSNQQFPWTAP